MDLPAARARIGAAALADLSREELVTLLTHELSGRRRPKDPVDQTIREPMTADEEVLQQLVLANLTRRDLVNLLSRRMWCSLRDRLFTRARRRPRLGPHSTA